MSQDAAVKRVHELAQAQDWAGLLALGDTELPLRRPLAMPNAAMTDIALSLVTAMTKPECDMAAAGLVWERWVATAAKDPARLPQLLAVVVFCANHPHATFLVRTVARAGLDILHTPGDVTAHAQLLLHNRHPNTTIPGLLDAMLPPTLEAIPILEAAHPDSGTSDRRSLLREIVDAPSGPSVPWPDESEIIAAFALVIDRMRTATARAALRTTFDEALAAAALARNVDSLETAAVHLPLRLIAAGMPLDESARTAILTPTAHATTARDLNWLQILVISIDDKTLLHRGLAAMKAQGVDLSSPFAHGRTALITAIEGWRTDAALALLKLGADPLRADPATERRHALAQCEHELTLAPSRKPLQEVLTMMRAIAARQAAAAAIERDPRTTPSAHFASPASFSSHPRAVA